MAEFVQRRKEEMIVEVPILESYFKPATVKRILNQREKFEYKLMRRNKQKSDFSQYIIFLESIITKVQKLDEESEKTSKLVDLLINRIISLYRSSLKYFKHDVSLWKEYIKFLINYKRIKLLRAVLDTVLLLHGHMSDELFVFAVKQGFVGLKNMQKTREMYSNGLRIHQNSSALYLEAFNCELAFCKRKIAQLSKLGKEFNPDDPEDPILNGSIAKVIFETAIQNVKDDFNVFFKMYLKSIKYSFASSLSKEIQNFMNNSFIMNPNYWNTLATYELKNPSNKIEKIKIKKCLDKYDEALSVIDTDEMWNMYLTTILNLTSDNENTEVYKRNLLRQSMYNAHMKNRLSQNHYIQWINKSKSTLVNEILDFAAIKYPNDKSILEIRLNHLITINKQEAYKLFLQNVKTVSPQLWITMVQQFLNEPEINNIFNMVFGDNSVCTKEVKKELGNEYLMWLSKNKPLSDVRSAYTKLIMNNECDASLCKTLVTIETEQENIDVAKIRQHFTLACMQFGKTDIDLWMERIYFEVKYGSPKLVSSTYHQALTTLNNEESDKFAEEYSINATKFNQL